MSVLLHELAHSLYALRKGGQVRDITLMMVGGVSQISEMPREPRHEAMMAFVGPLLSIVLGALLYGVHALLADTPWFQLRFAAFYLGGLNLFLGFFNLLPAFPMDGGRILRALLTPQLGPVRATRLAANVGKVFAVLFAVWGLYTMNLLLMVIAAFVYMGAESEKRAALVKSMIGQLRVRDLMSPPPAVGAPAVLQDDDAAHALRIMNETNASQLAVVAEDGSLVGSIDRADILRRSASARTRPVSRRSSPVRFSPSREPSQPPPRSGHHY